MTIQETLQERAQQHGPFEEDATYACRLRNVYHHKRLQMSYSHLMALDMICTKIARILSGDPYHEDHWQDIAGYALLGKEVKRDV